MTFIENRVPVIVWPILWLFKIQIYVFIAFMTAVNAVMK